MKNRGEKLGILVYLERRLQEKSTESKITRFGLIFAEKSRSEIEEEISFVKRERI